VKKTVFFAALAIFALTLSFTACDDFFTDGWGSSRDYKASNIDVKVGDLDKWIDRVVGNPPLAKLVSEDILNKVTSGSLSSNEKLLYQRAGVKIAVESSGLGVALLSNALDTLADVADKIDDLSESELEALLKDILSGIQGDFVKTGGVDAADNIADMVKMDIEGLDTLSDGDVPMFGDDSYFATIATASEIAKAILVLTLAEVEKSGIDIDDWEDFSLEDLDIGLRLSNDGKIETDGSAEPSALVLAAYLNLIASETTGKFNDNFLTKAIKDAFSLADE